MLLAHLPPDSATYRALHPDEEPWTRVEHLLAGVFDALQTIAWQNSSQGRKSPPPRPKPLPRPGIATTGEHWGTPAPLSEIKTRLAAMAPPGSRLHEEWVSGQVSNGS